MPATASAPAASAEPIFVSPAEAAFLLGLSRPEVYRLIKAGDLAGRREGTRHLVYLWSVHAYAYRHTRDGA